MIVFPVAENSATTTGILLFHLTKTRTVVATTALALSELALISAQLLAISTSCIALLTLTKNRPHSLLIHVLNQICTSMTRRNLLGFVGGEIFDSCDGDKDAMIVFNDCTGH